MAGDAEPGRALELRCEIDSPTRYPPDRHAQIVHPSGHDHGAIPLAVAGAFWGLLLFDKPLYKPATMGMIFLGGTVVNNSILQPDFILNARKTGMAKDEATLQSVRLRIRPILMTTVSTTVGLTPLVFEMAVGLERMSPLGSVAAMGPAVGTFLTMIVIPVVYSSIDTVAVGASSGLRWVLDLRPKAETVRKTTE